MVIRDLVTKPNAFFDQKLHHRLKTTIFFKEMFVFNVFVCSMNGIVCPFRCHHRCDIILRSHFRLRKYVTIRRIHTIIYG